jgi:hypothetical protein
MKKIKKEENLDVDNPKSKKRVNEVKALETIFNRLFTQ